MADDGPIDILAGIHAPGDADTRQVMRKRRLFYGVITTLLSLILLAALVGAVSRFDTVGVSTEQVRASGGGHDLEVSYASVSRPGLASELTIEVVREGGFSQPLTLAIDQEYIAMWDENGRNPAPSAEAARGEWLLWEFEPPDGDTFRFTFDGRIAPSVQSGRDGRIALMDGLEPLVAVDFYTRVMP